MLTLFTLPTDFVSSSTAYIGDLMTDGQAVLTLVVGISLGIWVINWLLGLITRRAKAK